MIQYLIDNLLPIGIAIAGAVAWFFDKRKRDAELKSVQVQNKHSEATAMQGMQDVYDKFVEDVKIQLVELKNENKDLRIRITELEENLRESAIEREGLISQMNEYKAQSEKDTKIIAQLKTKIESYEKELKAFRKEQT